MLANTKAIINAAIEGDATLTPEQRVRITEAINPKPKIKPRLGTTKEAARILSISTVTLRKYAKQGLLSPVRYTRRRIRWDLNEIESFRDQGQQGAPV